jgi:small subunit ribosomal protein S21
LGFGKRVNGCFTRTYLYESSHKFGLTSLTVNIKSRGRANLLVHVRDNNVDQALRALKKKMQREGVFREMKLRNFYEKPSEKKAREKGEARRRQRKLLRKRAQREGLLPHRGTR